MRIVFTTIAGTGHFNPLVPFAQEMLRRGYAVRVAAPQNMEERIVAAGFEHAVVDRPSDAELDAAFSKVWQLPPDKRGSFVNAEIFAGLLPRMSQPGLQKLVEDWKPHLIVREASEYGAVLVSAQTGVPHVRVSVSNGHNFSLAISPLDRFRQDLGLEPDQGTCLREARAFSSFPASMEPEDGDAAILPQFRVAPATFPVSTSRPDWLTPGERPNIYMTFGTAMGSSDQAKQTFRAALEAVGQSEVAAMMTTGPEIDVGALGEIPSNVVLRTFVPQEEVFPHVDAVLCHGGSGSVLGALAAGLPLVVTPIGADQPENAQQVAAVGAGISVDTPDAGALAAALDDVLSDPNYRRAALAIADEMAAHPSIEAAVDEMIRFSR